MERATYTTKSFLIALALVKRHITAEEAALAAQVEVSSQIQRWGEVEDCKFVTLRSLLMRSLSLRLEVPI
jgi:chaperone required for assembly of F1-ATPase